MILGNGFIEKKVIKDDIFDYKVDDYLEEEKCKYKIKPILKKYFYGNKKNYKKAIENLNIKEDK